MRRTNWFRKVVTAIVTLGLVCQMSFSGTVAYAAWDDNDTWENVQGWNENEGWEEVDEEDDEVIDYEDDEDEDEDESWDSLDDSEDESDWDDEDDDWEDVDEEDEVDEDEEDEVEEPTLSSTSLKLKAGSVVGLTVNGDYEYVEKWTSSNSSVAKVDSNGGIKAVKAGTAVITAKVICFIENDDDFFEDEDEDFFDEDEDFFEEDEEEDAEGVEITYTLTCKVKVTAPTIKISAKKLTITKGKSSKLKITGTTAKVTWKSSNKKVATVSKGTVKAKKAGKTTITAKVSGKTFKCSVTVKKK